MICLRCGYCCIKCSVIIVDDPQFGITENNLIHKKSGITCKHLKGDVPGQYSCAIHNKKWYRKTPCYRHGQIESENTNCRMGEFVLNNIDGGCNETK